VESLKYDQAGVLASNRILESRGVDEKKGLKRVVVVRIPPVDSTYILESGSGYAPLDPAPKYLQRRQKPPLSSTVL